MKLSSSNSQLYLTVLLFGSLIAFSPSIYAADWGSLHGNNRDTNAPEQHAAAPRQQQPQMNREPQQAVSRAPQPQVRQENPQVRQQPQTNRQPQTTARMPEQHQQPVSPLADHSQQSQARGPMQLLAHTPVAESNRRRMDIDEERRQSFYWSDFHAGMRIDRLPDGFRQLGVRGHPFFYYEGVYYDQGPMGYVTVDAPIDAVISDLPPGAETIIVNGSFYYYVDGAFYLQEPSGFVVVAAPIGVTVSMLPTDAVSVAMNGAIYYQANGTYFQPIMQNGVVAYLTVQPV